MELYKFEKLHQFLDKLGFPKVEKKDNIKLTKEKFERAKKEGKIEFTDWGIFYKNSQNEKKQIYVNLQDYLLDIPNKKTPRLHLINCKTIRERGSNSFCGSNEKTQDITDRNTGKVHNLELSICNHCKEELLGKGIDPKEFLKKLEKDIQENKKKQNVDLNGYTFDFQNISKKYRESKKYICERCGKKPKSPRDRYYWHTHHIDGDKINNNTYNFECLCIACHAKVDETHRENFKNKTTELRYFLEKYK